MVTVYAKCVVNAKDSEKFLNLAQELVNQSRKEDGNTSYALIKDINTPDTFAFLEQWGSSDILAVHMKTPHFTTLIPQIEQLLAQPMDIAVHEVVF